MSLPVIASNVNGNSELVQSELLVDSFMSSDYARKVEELINDNEFYNRISEENYARAMNFLPEVLDPKRKLFFEKLSYLSKRKK